MTETNKSGGGHSPAELAAATDAARKRVTTLRHEIETNPLAPEPMRSERLMALRDAIETYNAALTAEKHQR